jgi:hypothetical protein
MSEIAPATTPVVLASDAEREQVVLALRDAVVEGRLTLEEFSERVGGAQAARTNEQLAALTQDLPVSVRAVTPSTGAVAPSTARHSAVLSSLVRVGPWELAARTSFRAIFGTIELDLRQATLAGPEIELEISNIFSTVTIIVPEGVSVSVEGGGLMASQVVDMPDAARAPGGPRLRIRTSGPCGTLFVRPHDLHHRHLTAHLLGTGLRPR